MIPGAWGGPDESVSDATEYEGHGISGRRRVAFEQKKGVNNRKVGAIVNPVEPFQGDFVAPLSICFDVLDCVLVGTGLFELRRGSRARRGDRGDPGGGLGATDSRG